MQRGSRRIPLLRWIWNLKQMQKKLSKGQNLLVFKLSQTRLFCFTHLCSALDAYCLSAACSSSNHSNYGSFLSSTRSSPSTSGTCLWWSRTQKWSTTDSSNSMSWACLWCSTWWYSSLHAGRLIQSTSGRSVTLAWQSLDLSSVSIWWLCCTWPPDAFISSASCVWQEKPWWKNASVGMPCTGSKEIFKL